MITLQDQNVVFESCQCSLMVSHSDNSTSKWPKPHEHDINELIMKSMKECTKKIEVCLDSWGLKVICKKKEVSCTPTFSISNDDIASLHFGDDDDDLAYTPLNNTRTDIDDSIQSAVQSKLYEIAEQCNLIGSFYCFYSALMVFLGPPYILTSHKLSTKIQFAMGMVSKPWFIVLVLSLLYSAEIAQFLYLQLFVELNLVQMIQFTLSDPCFANGDFMDKLYAETAQICGDIDASRRSFEASQHNLDYYKSIEDTYERYYWQEVPDRDVPYKESERLFAGDVLGDHGTFTLFDHEVNEQFSVVLK